MLFDSATPAIEPQPSGATIVVPTRASHLEAHQEAQASHALVLVVEEDRDSARLLQADLTAAGHRVKVARCAAEARAEAVALLPDLILSDICLPDQDGISLAAWFRGQPAFDNVPILLVTSLDDASILARGLEAGADDFVAKPVDQNELLARIRALLRAKQSTEVLENAETVVFLLAHAVEARDPSTGNHVERVAQYAAALGRAIGLSQTEVDGLRRAGYVHDIGKIAVPDAILLKPGKLTPEERRVMERHVEVGYELLRPMRTFAASLAAVRFHHERLDGSGYPLGLRGAQVPITAQVLAIVDVYDALTTDRVYRPALSQSDAFDILADEVRRGLHDATLVATFMQVVRT